MHNTARATHARTTRAGTKILNLHTAHARGAAALSRRTARRPLRRLLPQHAHLGAAADLYGAARRPRRGGCRRQRCRRRRRCRRCRRCCRRRSRQSRQLSRRYLRSKGEGGERPAGRLRDPPRGSCSAASRQGGYRRISYRLQTHIEQATDAYRLRVRRCGGAAARPISDGGR